MCAAHGEKHPSARIRKEKSEAGEPQRPCEVAGCFGGAGAKRALGGKKIRVDLILLPSAGGTVFHLKLDCCAARIYKKEV
jgi:hypothetical protein